MPLRRLLTFLVHENALYLALLGIMCRELIVISLKLCPKQRVALVCFAHSFHVQTSTLGLIQLSVAVVTDATKEMRRDYGWLSPVTPQTRQATGALC